jgi:hypothetical protein
MSLWLMSLDIITKPERESFSHIALVFAAVSSHVLNDQTGLRLIGKIAFGRATRTSTGTLNAAALFNMLLYSKTLDLIDTLQYDLITSSLHKIMIPNFRCFGRIS